MKNRKLSMTTIAIFGSITVMLILVVGTVISGRTAQRDTEQAVRSVSLLYLDELAGRREQVVSSNLQNRISDAKTALGLMTADDLGSMESLQAYQEKMRSLFNLKKFAFVDTTGLIYTADGTKDSIADYSFDYSRIAGPEISILNLESTDKKVVIALPADISFENRQLVVCFMEIGMEDMLKGVSMNTGNGATFCNIYTRDGVALSNTVLGGLAVEDNLLEAMQHAAFENGYSYEEFLSDFGAGIRGEVSFNYNGIRETLSYVPVEGTDWLLTYLIRESVISDNISSISAGIIRRSLLQSLLTIFAMLVLFGFIIAQSRRNASLVLEKEKADTENRVKQQEMEEKLALQEKLLDQQQALSDALENAENANRAKTAFLSNMSHEIRTPMNAIIGLDNIALNDPDTPPQTREYLEKIGASAEHLLGLINDVLDMSRIESGRMVLKNEEFSFRKLLESVNTMFGSQCSTKGLEYHCRVIGSVCDYYVGDDMKLRQVLINILGNAVKFTPEGGRVEMCIERIARYKGQSTLRFVISDTGIGMSSEFLPHIFDTFSQEDSSSTSRYGSSGLGMAITKNIVEMMNGNIRVESEKGKGSTFTVEVTLTDSDRKEEQNDTREIQPEEMCVLVIDDDPVACEHAQLALGKERIAAETAASGEEALQKVKLRHVRGNPYNLILVDWKMPGMDGVETARRIRKISGSASAIIILTAYRWDEVMEEAMAAGVDSFVSKPLFAAPVIEEFRKAMARRKSVLVEKPRVELAGRRVLLAEDVQVNAEIIRMLLQMKGIDSDLAVNGREAVRMFEEHPQGYYDAVLMDMRMPEMDGLEATRRIRGMDRGDAQTIPVIALTANAFDEDVQQSMQAGLNAHLSKPVQPEILFETLEKLIRC